jgi:hypothetical protein
MDYYQSAAARLDQSHRDRGGLVTPRATCGPRATSRRWWVSAVVGAARLAGGVGLAGGAGVLAWAGIGAHALAAQPANEGSLPAALGGMRVGGKAGEVPGARDAFTIDAPSPVDAMAAFVSVEEWVRALRAPDEAERVSDAAVAMVTLRLDDAIIGRGHGTSGEGLAVWEAARAAIDEARDRIPVSGDALAAAVRSEAAQRLTIHLELGGALIPLPVESWEGVDARARAGLDGVGVRAPVRVEQAEPGVEVPRTGIALTFPSEMRAGGDTPSAGARRALSLASEKSILALPDDPETSPARLANELGVALFAFRVTSLAQMQADATPVFLYRGGRVVQASEVTRPTLEAMADAMAMHLASRPRAAVYNPARGTSDESAAAPSLALAAVALERWAQVRGESSDAGVRDAAAGAVTTIRACLVGAAEKAGALSPTDGAALVIAGVGREGTNASPEAQAIAGRAREALARAYSPEAGWNEKVAEPARGLVAWALAQVAADAASGSDDAAQARARASGAVRAVFRDTREGDLIAQMPWLLYAERALADAGTGGAGQQMLPSADALRNVRDTVVRHQLTARDAGDDGLDLVGGVVFTRGGASLPSWKSTRAIAFLSAALADPGVTPTDERVSALVPVLAGLRFVRQLTMDEVSTLVAVDRARALGGVQAAAWDPSQPIDATSLGLIAACETLAALDNIAPVAPAE